jgi:hypothetical protein
MKLVVERSGGFLGKTRRAERDGAALSSEQHAALTKVLQQSSTPAPPDPGADRFTYRIEVHDETGTKSVTVPESLVPQSLKNIVTE